jgi:hypothetical protein
LLVDFVVPLTLNHAKGILTSDNVAINRCTAALNQAKPINLPNFLATMLVGLKQMSNFAVHCEAIATIDAGGATRKEKKEQHLCINTLY